MTGLKMMNQIMDPALREDVLGKHVFNEEITIPERFPDKVDAGDQRSSKVRTDIPIPPAPYLDRKVRDVPQLTEVWSYINPFMLYGRHLGYKGPFEKNLAAPRTQSTGSCSNRHRRGKGSRFQVHEDSRGLAILRSGARRQLDPPVRTGREGRGPHVPLRTATAATTDSV